MRSRHADAFNHDPWAGDYDQRVLDDSNPIRAGYADVLAWTVEQARIEPDSVVLDLGSGTGNTTALIPRAGRILCVDVSREMTARARAKLSDRTEVEFLVADLLEVFDAPLPPLDAVVSTYSVHHLTEDEKNVLFAHVFDRLRPGGCAVFGDLMFEDADARAALAAAWSDEQRALVMKSLDEEFPWLVDPATAALREVGFHVTAVKRFSTLSWGIAAERPPPED